MGSSRRAFTLIEMLVATVLSAVLLAALLTALAAVARDRKTLRNLRPPSAGGFADLVAWDLRNARTVAAGSADDVVLTLVGNDGVDAATHAPDGRLVRVTYRVAGAALWRQQEYLDDPVRPLRWQECVTGAYRALTIDPQPSDRPMLVPQKVHLSVATADAVAEREVTR